MSIRFRPPAFTDAGLARLGRLIETLGKAGIAVTCADVYSRKAKIVVEVGHTVRSKAMLCAAAGYRFILVPFRHRGERPKAIEILFSDECRAVAKEIFQANRKATSAQIVENPCDE